MKVMVLGADGYLGWALSLYIGSTTDHTVYLVDNYKKRRWMDALDVKELHPVPFITDRVFQYSNLTGKKNLITDLFSVNNYQSVKRAVERINPDVIINSAQQPSAPYSMISPSTASETLLNNSETCLNVLWAVNEINPSILVINIGSAGSYLNTDTDFVPQEKVDLSFGDGHIVANSWLPMQASDIYHQSKANTFGMTDLFTKMWGLRTVTINQSTIFGQCANSALNTQEFYSRFTYDHIFGTVLNRFICQSVSGHPITVYGDGEDTTGLIFLCDCVQRITNCMYLDIAPGSHISVNNYSHRVSIKEMAERVVAINGGRIDYISSPRIQESMNQDKLFEEPSVAITPCMTDFDEEIKRVVDYVKQYAYNIQHNQMLPTITWGKR